MFTVTCITCEAKIRVKDESLAGQIVACPHCGSMVLLEPETSLPETPHPDDPSNIPSIPSIPSDSTSPPPHSVSSIPPPASEPLEIPDVTPSTEPAISEKEIRLRKGLLAVLGVLLVLLLLVTGLFVFFGGETGEEIPTAFIESQKTEEAKGGGASGIAAANPTTEEAVGQDAAQKPSASDETKELARTLETKETPTPEIATDATDSSISEQTAEVPFGFRKLARDVKTPAGMSRDEPSENRNDETGTEIAGNPDAARSETPSPDADSTEADRNRLLEMLKSRSGTNPVDVDVDAKLEFVVPELRLEDVPLLDVLRTLSRLADVPITVDCESLRETTVNVDRPVRVAWESQNVGTILENLLKPLGLTTVVELGQVTVTTDPEVARHRFPVDDLLPVFTEKTLPDMLATLLPLTDANTPENVSDTTDGANTPGFSLDGGVLCFQGSRKAANQALKFLETLRVLHKLPQRSPLQGEMLAPEAFGWDMVCQNTTLNFFRAEPLERILVLIEKTTPVPNGTEKAAPTGEALTDDAKKADLASGLDGQAERLRILVDHRTLHRNFTAFARLRSTVHCDGGTLDEAMENLLASTEGLPLDYRIVAKNVLEISTPEDLASPEKMSVELHLLPQTLQRLSGTTRTERIAEFLETLRKTIAPESWADTDGGGTLVVDEAAGALFVRQSQPVQRQIRRMIRELDLEQTVLVNEADKPGTIGEPAGATENTRP